jgi:uncharacterized protein YegP (UPF0339 family)
VVREEMRFVIDQGNDGRYQWQLVGDDGLVLAVSAVSFDSLEDARRAAADVREHAGSAPGTES